VVAAAVVVVEVAVAYPSSGGEVAVVAVASYPSCGGEVAVAWLRF